MPSAAVSVMEALRHADPDRYLSALYAPADKRDALFSLYGFNAEIAAVRDRAREALPGEVRLQWWRDMIASDAPDAAAGYPLAEALRHAVDRYGLPRQAFDNYLEARVFDLYDDPMPSRTDLEGYCGETASALIQLAAMVLDPAEAPSYADLAGHAGCAQAITGMLLLLPLHRARGQCFVPADILAAVGSSAPQFLADDGDRNKQGAALMAMIALARDHFGAFLRGAGSLPPALRPAYLPLALTDAYLNALERAGPDALIRTPRLSAWRRHWLLLRRASRGWN